MIGLEVWERSVRRWFKVEVVCRCVKRVVKLSSRVGSAETITKTEKPGVVIQAYYIQNV